MPPGYYPIWCPAPSHKVQELYHPPERVTGGREHCVNRESESRAVISRLGRGIRALGALRIHSLTYTRYIPTQGCSFGAPNWGSEVYNFYCLGLVRTTCFEPEPRSGPVQSFSDLSHRTNCSLLQKEKHSKQRPMYHTKRRIVTGDDDIFSPYRTSCWGFVCRHQI